MEQERFIVIDNQKGVVIPIQSEKTISIDKVKGIKEEDTNNSELEEKVQKIHMLMKALVKQSIKDTIKEYNLQLKAELKEYEKSEMKRWDKLEEADAKRWERLEENSEKYWEKLKTVETEYLEKMRKSEEQRWKHMEEHFESLDRSIREKQEEGKRKKHSIF